MEIQTLLGSRISLIPEEKVDFINILAPWKNNQAQIENFKRYCYSEGRNLTKGHAASLRNVVGIPVAKSVMTWIAMKFPSWQVDQEKINKWSRFLNFEQNFVLLNMDEEQEHEIGEAFLKDIILN